MPSITIVTAGSRGDVQPYLALAVGLKAAGHDVLLATHYDYKDWIESHGIAHHQVQGSPQEIVEQGQAADWLETGRDGFRFLTEWRDTMADHLMQAMVDTYEAAQNADFLIPSPVAYYAVHTTHEITGLPWVQTFLQPIHPTADFPSAIFPTPFRLGSWLNYASHLIGGQISWHVFRSSYNRVRRETFGLKNYPFFGPFIAVERDKVPALCAFSSHFIPRPSNWADHIHLTGYWFLDEGTDWQPPDHLATFIDEGPPPVYIGFGSMSTRDPEATAQLVLDALDQAEVRGVLLTGWQGLKAVDVPDTVCVIESAPHDWLFPRMAAVVHHCGAGTTAAGLRAGVPTVPVPFFGDQPWWADRIHEVGVGPEPILRSDLTPEKMAYALRTAVTHQGIRDRAAELGERICSEDGVGHAVELIEAAMNA